VHFLPQLLDLSLPAQRADTQALHYLEGKTPGAALPHDALFHLSPGASQVAIYLTDFYLFTASTPLEGVPAWLPLRYASGESSERRIEGILALSGGLYQFAFELLIFGEDEFGGVHGECHC
jgi:hypothetical protein